MATIAQAEHLPIYKASYDLCLYLERVTRNFSRAHKYTLGADLRDGTRRVLKLIVRANARYDKVPLLLEVREEIEALKVVVRLCQDVKAFSNFGAFEQTIGQVVEIAKQNEGWLKSQRQGHGQSRRAMPEGPAAPGAPVRRRLAARPDGRSRCWCWCRCGARVSVVRAPDGLGPSSRCQSSVSASDQIDVSARIIRPGADARPCSRSRRSSRPGRAISGCAAVGVT